MYIKAFYNPKGWGDCGLLFLLHRLYPSLSHSFLIHREEAIQLTILVFLGKPAPSSLPFIHRRDSQWAARQTWSFPCTPPETTRQTPTERQLVHLTDLLPCPCSAKPCGWLEIGHHWRDLHYGNQRTVQVTAPHFLFSPENWLLNIYQHFTGYGSKIIKRQGC